MIDVPDPLRVSFADQKDAIVDEALKATSLQDSQIAWKKLSAFDALVLNSRRDADESQSEAVARRLQMAADGA